ncbi:MAG: hypothetical protein ACRYFS_16325 [Janthinobacterium lividum]
MPEDNPSSAPAVRRSLLKGAGGRQTQPQNVNPFGGMPYAFVPRRMLAGMDLSKYRPEDFAPWQLMQILADSHTDVGLALWNVLRLGTKGFSYKVTTLKGEEDAESKALLDGTVPRINRKAGGIKAVHIQMMLSWYLYGAICGEMALTDNLKDILDLFPVNPFTIQFERDAATQELVMFQQQFYQRMGDGGATKSAPIAQKGEPGSSAGGYRRLNDLLVQYVPCDPTIDDPYGRIPSATVINEVFFDIQFLADLKKIVHGVGTPKYVIKIVEEILAKTCPAAVKNDPNKYGAWLDDRIAEVTEAFNALEPEEALVVFDSVEADILSAKSSTNILGLVTPLSRAIERRIIKALKMMPILMASNEGTTETHGSVQFEIFAEGIASAQEAITSMMAQFFKLYLELCGRQCLVTCEFAAIKTANRLLVANAENKEIINAMLKEAAGYTSHDDASIEITGSIAVGPAIAGILASIVPPLTTPSAEAPAAARALSDADLAEFERRTEEMFSRFWDEKQAKMEEDNDSVLAR